MPETPSSRKNFSPQITALQTILQHFFTVGMGLGCYQDYRIVYSKMAWQTPCSGIKAWGQQPNRVILDMAGQFSIYVQPTLATEKPRFKHRPTLYLLQPSLQRSYLRIMSFDQRQDQFGVNGSALTSITSFFGVHNELYGFHNSTCPYATLWHVCSIKEGTASLYLG